MAVKIWAEVGVWNNVPGLVIQKEEYEPDGDYREFAGVLTDVDLPYPEGWGEDSDMLDLPWEDALERLGFQSATGWAPTYLGDSVCFEITEV